jgi:hypothetical protein
MGNYFLVDFLVFFFDDFFVFLPPFLVAILLNSFHL